MTTATLALIIFAVIMAQLLIGGVWGWSRRERGARVPAVSSVPAVGAAGLAWEGFKEFRVRRRHLEDGQNTVCSFYLVPSDGQALPPFKPGQPGRVR